MVRVLGEGVVRVRPDMSTFGRELATKGRGNKILVTPDTSRYGRAVEQGVVGPTSRAGARVSTILKRAALVGGVGIAVGLRAAARGAGELVRESSAAQQSIGATESVFKRYADVVVARSGKAALAVGLSANEYRELSNVTGAMLKNSGAPLRQVTELTDKLNVRAADLAATYGGSTKEAIEAVSSLLRGEADPIERYGVSIKQSDVNARLAAQGLGELEGAALKQAESQARLALLFKQTADAQGQFGRESNTLAGVQQRLGAQTDNLQATLGGAFTPMLTRVGQVIGKDVLPPLQSLAERYAPQLGDALGDLAERVGPKVSSFLMGLPTALQGINRSASGNQLGQLASNASRLATGLQPALAALPSFTDALRVSNVVVKFAADNADKLAAALPFLATGYVAVKTAQVANAVVGRNSIIGFGLQISSTIALTQANRQLATSMLQVNAAQTGQAPAIAGAATGLGRYALAARTAAGAGGLGALAVGASTSSTALSTLANVGGGALTGFALGGPIGAAVGGTAGALLSLATNAGKAGDAAAESKTDWSGLAGTLDQVTGASTEATRVMIQQSLAQSGALDALTATGLGQREIVTAIAAGGSARQRLVTDLQNQKSAYEENAAAAEEAYLSERNRLAAAGNQQGLKTLDATYEATLKTNEATRAGIDAALAAVGATSKQADAARELYAQTRTYSEAIKRLPPAVQTRLRVDGMQGTNRAVVDLAREFKLMPKDIRILIRENGGKGTAAQVLAVRLAAKNFPRSLVTKVREDGVPKTRASIIDLTAKYNLTPRQVRTLIRESGGKPTERVVDAVTAAAERLDRQRPIPLIRANNQASPVIADANREVTAFDGRVATAVLRVVRQTGGGATTTRAFSTGGYVTGPGGPRDDRISARLSNGEYVINAAATARHRQLLDQINAGVRRTAPAPTPLAGGRGHLAASASPATYAQSPSLQHQGLGSGRIYLVLDDGTQISAYMRREAGVVIDRRDAETTAAERRNGPGDR